MHIKPKRYTVCKRKTKMHFSFFEWTINKQRAPLETQNRNKAKHKMSPSAPLETHLKSSRYFCDFCPPPPTCKSLLVLQSRDSSFQTSLPFVPRVLLSPSITLQACFPKSAAVRSPPLPACWALARRKTLTSVF